MKISKDYWWAVSSDEHELVVEAVEGIKDAQDFRSTDNLYHLRLYGNVAPTTLSSLGSASSAKSSQRHRVTLNVIQSCTDTVTARIAKNKPKATFLTTGGDWTMQQKAKRLDKFVAGQFYNSNIYEVAPKVFLDACVFGTGFMKIYESHNEIMKEIRLAAPDARRIFLPGNHEWRLFKPQVPEQIRTALHWKTHEPELRDHWEHPVQYLNCRHRGVFRLGQVVFNHGFAVSASSVKKETCTLAREWGLYVHGHLHRATQPGPPERVQMTANWLGNWWRANPGCMRDLKPAYMGQLDSSAWSQGAVIGRAQIIKSPRAKRCWDCRTDIFRPYDEWSARQ